jgi:hypothetical protein
MQKFRSLLVVLSLISAPSWASQYAIQLEASKVPKLERYRSLSAFGSLYTEAAGNGYIRTRLGPYQSRGEALEVLDQVHSAGYRDAIITPQTGQKKTIAALPANPGKHRYDIESFDVKTLKEWKMLSPEQQKNLVYLDGALHVKSGNEFVPLYEVISKQ